MTIPRKERTREHVGKLMRESEMRDASSSPMRIVSTYDLHGEGGARTSYGGDYLRSWRTNRTDFRLTGPHPSP
jgi:hypothetical protein